MKKKRATNLYYLAIVTAILSGATSVVSFYFISKIEADYSAVQRQYKVKAESYNAFISSVNENQFPEMNRLLNIGKLAELVATDSEIQILEDEFQELVLLNRDYRMSCALDSYFNLLRFHGSDKVITYCDDILAVISLRTS